MPSIHTSRSPKNWAYFLLIFLSNIEFVYAGSYGVNPVKLMLSAQTPTQIITVRNDGAEATVIQVELAAWSQVNGQDSHLPTRELLATPPIFTLPVGASQIIRVGLRRLPDVQRELAYRMFLQEVPPPVKSDAAGLQVALRISIPVYVTPPNPVKPVLSWQAVRFDEHTLKVTVTNTGDSHDHLSAYRIYRTGNANPIITKQLFTYLLSDKPHYWSFTTNSMPNPGEHLRILATTEMGEVNADIVMDKP
ncbi:fimbria/pilus periplasmic chaperone [Methylobacter sp. S3L5C]|nr:fimbria/pilus periplasmic chaperone [Methylobacter sp. S3L5C]UOA09792.1 fimbria/pilus periplasmic chaperone [Methylobacter sp. S3L5C]